MRILNVTETYAPFFEFGGPPVKVRALSEGLARRGHQVTVLTPDWGIEKRKQGEGEKFRTEMSPFGWRVEENGVQAIYLPTWLRYRTVSWNPAAKRYCRARLQNFDIVHIFGLYDLLGPAVAVACRRRGKSYVLEPIGMFVPIVRSLHMKRLYHMLWGKALLRGARAVISTSVLEAEELTAGGVPKDKLLLRRNGVEVPDSWPERGIFRKAQGISSEAKLILFLGRLSAKKSPELLLQAVAKLPAEMDGKTVILVFVGPDEGGMQGQLKQVASRVGIGNRVRFPGAIFGSEKWAAYRDADVFVLPSQNENFGNAAAEAVAAGTPAVVSERCGIAPLLVGKAGLAVPHDATALSQTLARILGEPQLHARLTSGCAQVASQLGWEEPIREIEQMYIRLLQSGE